MQAIKTRDSEQLPENKHLVNSNPCYRKVEDCAVDPDVNLDLLTFRGTDNEIISVTKTVGFDMERLKYHINLYNQSFGKEGEDKVKQNENPFFEDLPKAFRVKSSSLNQQTGLATFSASLLIRRKRTLLGQNAMNKEREMSEFPIHQCSSAKQLDIFFDEQMKRRETIRGFYYSNASSKRARRLELSKKRHYDVLAAKERRFCKGLNNAVMFVGDRGHGYGSTIKEHLRFGVHQKEKRNARYGPILITNERNISQTCVFCFRKLSNPHFVADGKIKITKGTFVCLNENCTQKYKSLSIDRLSAFGIGLAGATQLLLGSTFPCFNPKKTTKESYENFRIISSGFLNKKHH